MPSYSQTRTPKSREKENYLPQVYGKNEGKAAKGRKYDNLSMMNSSFRAMQERSQNKYQFVDIVNKMLYNDS